jgi:hypothetical protein
MAHELQERYAKIVLAKVRADNVLRDGVVFNTDYEGDPTAGAVKIPVRDQEVGISDYDKANGIPATTGSTAYLTVPITRDKAINEIIDGYDAAGVPDNLVADRLDSAAYTLTTTVDTDGGSQLLAEGTKVSYGTLTKDNIYATCVDIREKLTKAKVPSDGKRYLIVTASVYSLLLTCPDISRLPTLATLWYKKA